MECFANQGNPVCISEAVYYSAELGFGTFFWYRRYRYLVLENGSFGFGISVPSLNGSFAIGILVLHFGTLGKTIYVKKV